MINVNLAEQKLFNMMVEHDSPNSHRIQHFLKVQAFALRIAKGENISSDTYELIRALALVHDVGIKIADEKYGKHPGPLQEKEGAPAAKAMCMAAGYDEVVAERISYVVGHHHTYTNIDGLDYQILVEADFLVNLHEDSLDKKAIASCYKNIFRTETGKKLCRLMFGLEAKEDEL